MQKISIETRMNGEGLVMSNVPMTISVCFRSCVLKLFMLLY